MSGNSTILCFSRFLYQIISKSDREIFGITKTQWFWRRPTVGERDVVLVLVVVRAMKVRVQWPRVLTVHHSHNNTGEISEGGSTTATQTPAFYDNFYWGGNNQILFTDSLTAPSLSEWSLAASFLQYNYNIITITGRRRRRWRKGTGVVSWRTDCPITPGTGEPSPRSWPGWALR